MALQAAWAVITSDLHSTDSHLPAVLSCWIITTRLAEGKDVHRMGERLFQRLKPVCVELIRAPAAEQLDSLVGIVETTDQEDLQPLQQYVLLPLRIILKGEPPRSSKVYQEAVRAIDGVFQHSKASSWEVFSDFFVTLTLLIAHGPAKADKAMDIPEELKLNATRCLKSLVEAATAEVLEMLFSLEFLPPLGHTISVLLTLVEEEQLRPLRLDAMLCLSSLMVNSDSSRNLSCIARSRFCSFLPGISMSLSRVIQGDPKQGQNITKIAISTWAKAVTWIMSDSLPVEEEPSVRVDTRPTMRDPSSLVVRRTADWLKNTSTKLCILIGQICKQKTNGSWQVRLALVNFAKDLLLTCKSNLSESVSSLLALLVSLLADDWPAVAKASRGALDEFKKKHMDSDDNKLVEIFEENLHSTMTALPRLMRSTDDEQKLSTLNLVQGYLTLLGPKMNQFLRSSSHLHRLSLGLLQVLEFDVKDALLLEEATLTQQAIDVPVTPSKPLYYTFKSFSDDRILHVILNICQLLGSYGDLMLLVDHFLDLFRQSSLHRKQASLVINHILRGTLDITSDASSQFSKGDTSTLETVVQMVVDEYILDSHWSLVTSSVNQSPASPSMSEGLVLPQRNRVAVTTLQEIQNNTLLACLILEGIGDCAEVLGPAFSPHLMQCLYPLLGKLAADKAVVRQRALHTLQSIACSCGYNSIPSLLSNNADYLVDAISSRLRHLEWYSQAPHVLKVTIEQSDADILPLLDDTIEEILWSLDSHFSEQASSFVTVLRTVASAILRWFPPVESSIDENPPKSDVSSLLLAHKEKETSISQEHRINSTAIEEIQEFFLNHLRNKRLAEGEFTEADVGVGEEDTTSEVQGDDLDQRKPLPLHVQTAVKILERCKHLLATRDPRIRLNILSTVQICVQALTGHKDELLPLVHKIWPSLVPRFMDEEPLVICEACTTLRTLSQSCGDFLRQRVSKDVLPKLTTVLSSSAVTSRKVGPAYVHTASHKLQLAILDLVGPLCERLDIGENDLGTLSAVCVEYLSCGQPVTLPETCRRAFSFFLRLEPDALWLLLNEVCCPVLPTPPSEEFPVVKFKSNPRAKEFEANINKLLLELECNAVKSGEG